MVNSYNMNAYPQNMQQQVMPNQDFSQQNMMNNQIYQQNSYSNMNFRPKTPNGPSTLGMMTLGALGGGTVGYFVNRHPVKDGVVSDNFAKNAFKKYIDKNLSSDSKKFFKESDNILKKIDKVKNTGEFKKLMNKNKTVTNVPVNGIPLKTILDTVNPENLSSKKSTLKNGLQSWLDFNISNMKDTIKYCWDSENKKFVKPDNMDSKIFDAIKSTNTTNKWKKAGKYAAITAGILGALTIGYKIIASKITLNKNVKHFFLQNRLFKLRKPKQVAVPFTNITLY